MKIAWFTPFSKDSAIALYSKYACEALAQTNEITIYTSSTENIRDTFLMVKFYEDFTQECVQLFDVIVYNIGNYGPWHSEIVSFSEKYPGILILHDLCLLDLLIAYYTEYKKDSNRLVEILLQYYGKSATQEILTATQNIEQWNALNFYKYSGVEWILENAHGVIVHSYYHLNFIKEHFKGPSAVAYFPYRNLSSDYTKPPKSSNKGRLNLLTVGCVNPNKRILQVIEAIGTSKELSAHVVYTVAGSLANQQYAKMLKEQVARYSLADTVYLKGYASDDELENLYNNADVLVNLRNPAIEGASWSLVEQMWHGKAVIVTDTGFYSEIPDDCVYKIPSETSAEVATLQHKLSELIASPQTVQKMGNTAWNYVRKSFSPEQYVSSITDFLERQAFVSPLESLVDQVIQELSIMDIGVNMNICRSYANEIEHLFYK